MTPRERETEEISKVKQYAIAIFMFSGFFGVIILISASTAIGVYLGWFFLFISFIVLVIWGMFSLAGKADEFVGKHT